MITNTIPGINVQEPLPPPESEWDIPQIYMTCTQLRIIIHDNTCYTQLICIGTSATWE